MIDNTCKEDVEAGLFLHVASKTSNVLSYPTFQSFWSKLYTAITELFNTCMNFVRDVLAHADSAPIGVLFWMNHPKNSDAGKQLLSARNTDNTKYGDGDDSDPGGGCST